MTAHPSQTAVGEVDCHSDEFATGGGFTLGGAPNGKFSILKSDGGGPGSAGGGWDVAVLNTDTVDHDFVVSAVCIKLVP
jgi:hypothetical protein